MKTPSIITVISTLTLAAGCAHHERYASYDDTASSSAYGSTAYNSSRTYNSSSTSVSPGASTSASGVYGAQPGSPDYSSSGSISVASDQNLTAQVQQSIYNDNTLVTIAPQIHVIAQPGGTVVLTGKVPNDEQKQVIEQRVKQVAGVVNVRNDIQVSLDPTGRTGHSSRIYSNSISGAQSGLGAAQSDSGGQIVGSASSPVSPDATSSAGVSGQVDLQNKSWESKQLKPTSNSSANRQYGKDQSGATPVPATQPEQSSPAAVEDKYASPSANNNQSSATGDAAAPSTVVSSSGTSADSSGSKSAAVNAALDSQAAQTPGAATSPGTSQSEVGTLPGATQSGSASVSDTSNAKGALSDSSPAAPEGKGSTSDRSPSSLSGASSGSSSGTSSGGKEGVNVQVQGTTDSDRALGQQITQQLRADSELSAALPMLRIKIDNGKATLRGNVKSEDQKKKVESTVQQVTGVSSVENQLRVGASTSGTTNP